MDTTPKFSFPRIEKIQLKKFSLYRNKPNLNIAIPQGVFCLAGANGLGKSTFLAAVNFCLTGFVPTPKYNYLSADEYYKKNRNDSSFTKDFFSGRINELDREDAEINLVISIGKYKCELARGIFTPNGLKRFTLYERGTKISDWTSEEHDPLKIETEYQQWLTQQIGVNNFQQYVFLQHIVFTFDEARNLLLWENRALNDALYLCIGGDPATLFWTVS